jgi:hypothetical protein
MDNNLEIYLVQEYIAGREFSVGIVPTFLGDEVETLTPIEVIPIPERLVFCQGLIDGLHECRLQKS